MNTSPPTPSVLSARYRFDRVLGAGGQGRTWLAERVQDGVLVAIKALHVAHIDNWKAVELFEREARVLKGLQIEGVPRLFEYVAAPDAPEGPSFFLVQEYIEGETLDARVADGRRFTEEEVVALAVQVLDILLVLHGLSPPVIHRDIKPANVMLRPDGRCVLLDFGAVADSLRSVEGGSTVAGTFGYMAPEQFHGRATAASDLYGLGTTMVHLLSAKAPSEMDVDMFRLNFRPHVQVSPPLLGLLDRLLEPEERERLSSAAEVRQILTHLDAAPVDDEPSELAPVASLVDLVAVGQRGSMALFHGAGAPPRRVPAPYMRHIAGRMALLIGGGGLAAAAAVSGLLAVFGLGTMELFMVVALPFVLTWSLLRGSRRLRRLIRRGERAHGTVRGMRSRSTSIEVSYDFSVRGQTHSGWSNIAGADVLLAAGDEIGVLYDPRDPSVSMLYPVPPRCVLRLFDED